MCTYLSISEEPEPESAVLDGFVVLSKLNVLGLRECGEVVVEFAIQSFESVIVFWIFVLDVDVEEYVAPLLPGTVTFGV